MASSIHNLLRSDLPGFAPYTPIVPLDVLAQQLGLTRDQLIKLDANENPYGPTAATRAALAALATPTGAQEVVALYPDPDNTALRTAISEHLNQPIARIICGNGSDELIDLLLRATVTPGRTVVDVTPTFGMYAFGAHLYQANLVEVPRTDTFEIDVTALRQAIMAHQAVIVFLAAPNNPTGNPLSRADLLAILELPVVVVADEAYAEFSGETFLDLIDDYPNLVVLRTLSKWAGLAGLRIGYGVMHESMADELRKIKQPYTVNVAAEVAATAAIRDFASMQPIIAQINADRERLVAALQTLDCAVYPSTANFVLVRPPVSARALRDELRRQGVLIRYFAKERLSDLMRISVGTPHQHERLLEVLADSIKLIKSQG